MQALRGIPCERHRAVFAYDSEEHGEIKRREILRFVHEEMLINERALPFAKLASKKLISPQEECIVLWIEHCALIASYFLRVRAESVGLVSALSLVRERRRPLCPITGIEIQHGRHFPADFGEELEGLGIEALLLEQTRIDERGGHMRRELSQDVRIAL